MPDKTQDRVPDVRVAAHTLVLPRGKFCISVSEVSPGVPPAQLPGLSISVMPGEGSEVEIAQFRGSPWLRQLGDALLVAVASEEARLLLTSYNLLEHKGAKPPRMHVQRLDVPGQQASLGPVREEEKPRAPVRAPAAVPPAAATRGANTMLLHIARVGDRAGALGEWLGLREPGCVIEGIQLAPPEGVPPEELEYQVVLGRGWTSPWSQGGEFCGSRGMRLPVQGLRVALRGASAERFTVHVEAVTASGQTLGPTGNDELCGLEDPEPLAQLRLRFEERLAKMGTKRGRAQPSAGRRPSPDGHSLGRSRLIRGS
ncbi:hypothetical protein [Sabulicella rubraurantiaca]|uniref:hypothetical protein n=1 Tax=Sabulicella rubraurantiaca TaxID=2811429 RepID=UPI001A9795DF|nr:hypothetical protein [Sabulicella rubraurantiaca]